MTKPAFEGASRGIPWRLAWRNLGRNRRRTALTAAAGAFAALLTLVSLALARGSHERWIDQAVRLYPGHVRLASAGYEEHRTLEYGMRLDPELRRALDALPGSVGWAPRLETWGLAVRDADDSLGRGAWIVGVEPERERELTRVLQSLDPAALARAGAPGIVLGSDLARGLGVGPGENVILLTGDYYGSQAAERFRVAGTLSVGDPRFDERAAFARVGDLQAFLDAGGTLSHVALFARSGGEAGDLARELSEALPGGYEILAWPELVPEVVQIMQLDDVGNFLSLSILIVVVGFGLLNTVLASVLERRREFGMLRALGMRPRGVFRLVVLESLLLAALGIAAGLALAVPLLLVLEPHPIPLAGEQFDAAMETYRLDPVLVFDLTAAQVLGTSATLLVVALLAALPPALRAARGRPQEALRELA